MALSSGRTAAIAHLATAAAGTLPSLVFLHPSALARPNSEVAIEANLQCSSPLENQIVSRFKSRDSSFSSSGTRAGRGRAVSASPLPFRRTTTSSHNDRLGNLLLRHSLATDFSFFADLPQPMLTRNSRNRGDERNRSS